MAMLRHLFSPKNKKNQQQIAGRAAAVIDRVIFDVGVDRFVNGTLLLDKKLRLRFFGGRPAPGLEAIAAVPVSELAEARVFRAMVEDVAIDSATLNLHTGCLVHGLMRELRARSEVVRALP
jgi:hypothetical protein